MVVVYCGVIVVCCEIFGECVFGLVCGVGYEYDGCVCCLFCLFY